MEPLLDIQEIREAARRIQGHVVRTPLIASQPLSAWLGCEVYLKLESLQKTGSFKDRGVCNKLTHLSEKRAAGEKLGEKLIAVSAGNHAQAVAFFAPHFGFEAKVLMPQNPSQIKYIKVREFGANIELIGKTLDDSGPRLAELMQEGGYNLVHPFDDRRVMAGQGTVGLEILEDLPDPDIVIVPIGGGGLISGIASVLKHAHRRTLVVGVEVDSYAFMKEAVHGGPPPQPHPTLADGIAVKKPGAANRAHVEAHVDVLATVSEADIEWAVQELLMQGRVLTEGSGAAPLACLWHHAEMWRGKKVVLVLSGGNIDPKVVSTLLLRRMTRTGQMINLEVHIEDRPGVLGTVSTTIGKMGGNILAVEHHRLFTQVRVKDAKLHMTVETQDQTHSAAMIEALREQGFHVKLL